MSRHVMNTVRVDRDALLTLVEHTAREFIPPHVDAARKRLKEALSRPIGAEALVAGLEQPKRRGKR